MITVEELIVHGLYHRLVLITVRRTPDPGNSPHPDSSANDGGDQATARGATEVADSCGTMPSQGLGYLCLGPPGSLPSPGNHHVSSNNHHASNNVALGSVEMACAEQSLTGSNALIESLKASGENVMVSRTLLEMGDMKMAQILMKSSEVQTDFEPMWCFGSNAFPIPPPSSSLLPFPSSSSSSNPLIDLRNCEQFSIVCLEDTQNPGAQSLIMVNASDVNSSDDEKRKSQTSDADGTKMNRDDTQDDVSFVCSSDFQMNSQRLRGGEGLFVEDSRGCLTFKPILGSSVHGRSAEKSQEVDSGIWDMMQALESGRPLFLPDVETVETNAIDIAKAFPQAHFTYDGSQSQSTSELSGTYKAFTISDQLESDASAVEYELQSNEREDGKFGDAVTSCWNDGGLSDALKPTTVMNFVVHRVEGETMRWERVENAVQMNKTPKSKFVKKKVSHTLRNFDGRNRRTASLRAARKSGKIQCQTCVKAKTDAYQSTSKEVDDSHYDSDVTQVTDRNELHKLCSQIQNLTVDGERRVGCGCPEEVEKSRTSDDESERERYKDIIEITSLKVDRRPGSSRNLSEMTRSHKNEIRRRKSQSERSSPYSSITDLCQLQKTDDGTYESRQVSVPDRHSFPLTDGIEVSTSQSETPRSDGWPAEFPCHLSPGSATTDWGSDKRSSCGTIESISISNLIDESEPPQFEKFPDWMKRLPVELHSLPLSELCIPGSHIAVAIEKDMRTDLDFSKCNYEMAEFLRKLPNLSVFNNFRDHMKSIWKSWMPKQWLGVHDQLLAGSRYLDIRITKHNSALYGEHGLYTRQLKKYLKEMRLFMEEQPSEVIILHFQSSNYVDRTDKRHLVTMLFQVFGAKMACRSSDGCLPNLEWMWNSRKQLVILFPDCDMDAIKNHIFGGLVWSDAIVDVTTSKKQTVVQLIEYLESLTTTLADRDPSKLFICKAVLSPDMSTVFGKFEHRCMRELVSTEISKAVDDWLTERNDLNVVAIDFVGVGDVVKSIIKLNNSNVLKKK